MNSKEAIKTAKEIISKIKELKEVNSVVIYGSLAKGIFDKYPDIDILCFCKKISNNKKRVNKVLEIEGITQRKQKWYLQDPFIY